MKITTFSHFFSVTEFKRSGYERVKKFAFENFAEYDYRAFFMARKWGGGKQAKPELKRIYASYTDNKHEFRFHIHSLENFTKYLDSEFIQYEIENVSLFNFKKVSYEVAEWFTPRVDQVPHIDYMVDEGGTKMLNLPPGAGKLQRVTEPVLTPTGWRPIGELKVGDVVCTPDGGTANVTGVFPQGEKLQYKVVFQDGRFTHAGEEHLWTMHNHNWLNSSKPWRVGTTKDLKQNMIKTGNRVYIPLIKPWSGIPSTLPVEPYLLGALIGDGCLRNRVTLTTPDNHIVDRIRQTVINYDCELVSCPGSDIEYRVRNVGKLGEHNLRKRLMHLGIFNHNAHTKFIPDIYLNASYPDRLALIQGLFDTDGFASITGHIEYYTTSRQLADDVIYLIRSFGDIANLRVKHSPKYTYRGEIRYGKECYVVSVRSQNPERLFTLPRKQERVMRHTFYAKDRKLRVVDIIPENVEQSVCIMIDHPQHLYITKDFIVTHNTATSLYSCAQMGGKIVISLETRFFNIWKDALLPGKKQVLKLTAEEVMFVQGSKDLKALIELGIAGELDEVKVFVVASRTMGLFIEAYERSNGDLQGIYGCNPEDFHEVVDAPIKIKDEVHLGLHANFKEVVNTHTHKYIALSGTLEDGSFRDNIFKILFPFEIRSPESEFMKYIEVTALMYSIRNMNKVRTSHRGMSDYSHNAFEQSILGNRKLYEGYLKIISEWLQSVYVNHRQKGMRAAIFVESIELATEIHKDLGKTFKELTFGRYCASTGDKYKEAREADVLITTVKSFGTGFDMEDLYCAFMTNSIRSQNTNIQVLFRLRQLKNFPGIFPKFYYLVCSDIPKHMEYHEEKKLQFSGKVKSHVTKFIGSDL